MDANPQPEDQPDVSDLEPVEVPASEYAVRSREEIGGKRFRVGLDDDYVPFRNRKRRRRRTVGAAISGLLVVGVGAYGLVSLVTAPDQHSAASACKQGSSPALTTRDQSKNAAGAGVSQFTLNVYNSTDRKGLAAHTAAELKARGFAIGQVTNDPLKSKLNGAAQVRGAGASNIELREVAAEVQGAQIQTDSRNDPSIDLVLGSTFDTLASASQVSAALHAAGLSSPSAAAVAAPSNCGH
jgi:hypothetical protein